MRTLEEDLRSQIQLYVSRKLTLRQLEKWSAQRLPVLFVEPNSSAAKLAAALELGLAELGNKTLSEKELRHLLKEVLSQQIAA